MQRDKLYNVARDNIREYGAHTIEDRAIPDFRDGLKPVQRRIIWAMSQLGLKPTGGFVKSARVVGECFARGTKILTPKGEVPIEDINIGDTVQTSQGPRKVTKLFQNPPDKLFKLTLADGKQVILTENQEVKILAPDGTFRWKTAGALKEDDQIVVF